MDWHNYRLLVDDLKQLPPERFNYANANKGASCGCLAVQVFRLAPACEVNNQIDGYEDWLLPGTIGRFLGISDDDAQYLFFATVAEPDALPHLLGAGGIAEALRRLAVVAARYGGPPADAEPQSTFQPDESAFLASCRALTSAPLVEIE